MIGPSDRSTRTTPGNNLHRLLAGLGSGVVLLVVRSVRSPGADTVSVTRPCLPAATGPTAHATTLRVTSAAQPWGSDAGRFRTVNSMRTPVAR